MRLINKNSKRGIVNLFADFILSKIDQNENSIIQISDSGYFYLVNGITTSESFLDINSLRDEFVEKYKDLLDYLDIKSINVVDVIKYDQKVDNLENGWIKINKTPFIPEYEPLSEITITSEFPYGHSMNCGRLMTYYSHYMFNHIFSSIMTDEINFYFTKELNSNEDFDIQIETKKGLNPEMIKSLILDVFNFDLKEFSEKLKGYDFTQDIINPMGEKPYLTQDRLEDCIVF
jgi:hypothetical protein